MNSERAAYSPLAHADAMRKVAALGVGKLPKLVPILREQAMIASAALCRSRRSAGAGASCNAGRPVTETRWHHRSSYAMPGELLDLIDATSGRYAQDVRDADRIVTDVEHSVVTLSDATVYTNGVTHRSVFDAAGTLRPDLSSFRGRLPTSGKLSLVPNRRVPGRTLNAFGTLAMAGGNYSHWLIDGISMLFQIAKVHERLTTDHVIVPPMFHDFHPQSLELFGIDPNRVIELAPLDILEFEELLCATSPRGRASAIQPGWAIDGYRSLLLPDRPPTPHRKIYVSRRDAPSRNFVNEREVSDYLEARGFTTVELSAFDLAGKATLFAEASCIVSLSGAGLANVMFCDPKCTVLEIQPPKLLSYNIGAICSHVGCRYDFLLAEDQSVMSRYNPYFGELSLDLEKFGKTLDRLDNS